jgi:hypothetical protein
LGIGVLANGPISALKAVPEAKGGAGNFADQPGAIDDLGRVQDEIKRRQRRSAKGGQADERELHFLEADGESCPLAASAK